MRVVLSALPPPPLPCRGRAAAAAGPARASARLGGVSLRDVTFRPPGAGDAALLRDVRLELPPRGLALLVGASGSGKTTLLSLIAGLCEPSTGSAAVGELAEGGEQHTPAAVRTARVGFVFQFPERHFLGASLAEELTFGWPRGHEGAAARQANTAAALATLAACGLTGVPLGTQLAALSGGMQRRVALAVQLARAPPVLLLDEPLAGLDWEGRRELLPMLAAAARAGLVLAATHDVAPLMPLVSAGVWRMDGGRLRREA
jgi:energy-coupling factor transporter ATP-binding protein EcfA2